MKTTTNEGEQLRRAISQRRFPTSRLSADVHARAFSYAHRRSAEGAPARAIAEELGVSVVSVDRWLRDRPRGALIPVQVTPDATQCSSSFEVVTARGLRVVGLDLETLCTLLQRHG